MNYSPRLEKTRIEEDLRALLVSGRVMDEGLERRVARLAEMFRIYNGCYPYGLWAPGLAIDREMRTLTEAYLPVDEITRAFDRLFSAALKFPPFLAASIVHNSTGWLDMLRKLQPLVARPNPATLLGTLMKDEEYRRRFIFANFMPVHYGGGFGRYPGQARFLAEWLDENRSTLAAGVRCLDAGCGSGEGTYDLAQLLIDKGFAAAYIHVRGATLEPLELFAAAHAFFPHDLEREAAFRRRIRPLFDCGAAGNISFHLEELGCMNPAKEKGYDIILCNGLLGGPFFHDPGGLAETVRMISNRLNSGGILLAASRFHGGWKKLLSDQAVREIFCACGLKMVEVAEGVGGVRVKG